MCGFSQTRDPRRPYGHPDNPLYGADMEIETPNNTVGALEFANGVLCAFLTSSEGINVTNHFTIYGTEGTLTLNDPNTFGGPVLLKCKGESEARQLPLMHAFTTNMRGLGAADLAYAVRNRRPPRCSLDMALHTFEAAMVMAGLEEDSPCIRCGLPASGPSRWLRIHRVPRAGSRPVKESNMSKISLQMATLRDYTKTPAALDRTLGRLVEIGYRVIQPRIPEGMTTGRSGLLRAHGMRADSCMGDIDSPNP